MKGKRRGDSYKIIFFLCSQSYNLAMDRCLGVMSVGLAEETLRREYNTSKRRISSLTAFVPESGSDSSNFESENICRGWKLYFVHPASTHLTSGTMIFFSEPHCHVWHGFLPGDSVRLTFPSYSSGLSGYPGLGDRVYNTHWSLGPRADGPNWQGRASNLWLQLEFLGKSICLSTGVSNKVRFRI